MFLECRCGCQVLKGRVKDEKDWAGNTLMHARPGWTLFAKMTEKPGLVSGPFPH